MTSSGASGAGQWCCVAAVVIPNSALSVQADILGGVFFLHCVGDFRRVHCLLHPLLLCPQAGLHRVAHGACRSCERWRVLSSPHLSGSLAQLPGHNNAESLYKNIIRPLLVKYEVVIDETIERTLEGSKEVGGAVRDAGVAAAKSKQGREAIAAAAEVASDMVSPTADEEEETPATDAAAKKDL